jgi:hypothetical protein
MTFKELFSKQRRCKHIFYQIASNRAPMWDAKGNKCGFTYNAMRKCVKCEKYEYHTVHMAEGNKSFAQRKNKRELLK